MTLAELKTSEGYRAKAREYRRRKYAEDPETARAYAREWSAKNREKIRKRRMQLYYANREKALQQQRAQKLKRAYGITIEEFEVLEAKQGGVCAICENASTDGKRLHVDHCHKTGRVRGLLCNRCNPAIGALGDDPRSLTRALVYLQSALE